MDKTSESVGYRCKKCGSLLFKQEHILYHGVPRSSEDRPLKILTDSNQSFIDKCTVFISTMEWMKELKNQTGKLNCPNIKCRAKLGSYSWFGMQCTCGYWQAPAFQVYRSRVDLLSLTGSHGNFAIELKY
ncbi:uncharacterized protein CMU_013240 [Cryptosporidium muris RN66]|uniref:Uncharacterized protein n=1 Tax=Cryptosporidium muris (strain RN66) TaxID=441375 RepID=B6AEN2_CRYMR|nr:uncharacterized protein CMU_013240 [Cryptosporidium muris RN66]EEA06649.1 hypothetical protein, conserved [Cryptosporidium muris RN66]|eukprot:XP_002140998.1 hypothetical protein [Cryptosporidium muris RN66]